MQVVRLLAACTLVASVALAAAPASATHDKRDGIPCALEDSDPLVRGPYNVFLEEVRAVVEQPPAGTVDVGAPTAVLVYQETNGVEGIQRDDTFEQDEDCFHGSDRLIVAAGCSHTLEVPGDTGFWDSTPHGCAIGANPPQT